MPEAEAAADAADAADADEERIGVAGAAQPAPTAPTRQRDRVSSAVQETARRGFRENAGVDSGAGREVERAVSADRRDAPAERQQRLVADQLAAAAKTVAQGGGTASKRLSRRPSCERAR